MKQIVACLVILVSFFGISGCRSIPKYPSDKAWTHTPLFQSDHKTLEVQGDFKNQTDEFLLAASKLKNDMAREEVKALGFNPDLKTQPCDEIGWLEASQTAIGNTQIKENTIEAVVENRKQYSAIRCRARDIKTRADRTFTYINHRDIYGKGIDITLMILFRNNKVVGVDINKRSIKPHERQSALLQILGDIINPPKINVAPKMTIP